ncbi:hypothetical protein J4204_03125 [Candidatus Woesearchaeota archaeon]|nr:hypothetical protein [Candidatus Woesearchaeota archaeon]
MVKEIKKSGKKYFECIECNFVYKNKKIAEECEGYCKKHHSCNTEITKYSIQV